MAVWQVPGETELLPLPPFTMRRADLQPGPAEIRLDGHLVTYSAQAAKRRQCLDGGPWHGVTERTGSVGFLPAGTLLEADILEPTTLAAIEVPRGWSVGSASAVADSLPVAFGQLDPVVYQAAMLVEAIARDPTRSAYLLMPAEQVVAGILGRLARRQAGGDFLEMTDREYRLARARAYVESHLHRNIALADMAGAAALSVHHFGRLFRAATGQTPLRYVVSQRAARARRLLLTDPTMTMTEMAAVCGFTTQSHFNEVFKREVGMSPGAYRRAQGGAGGPAAGGD